MRRRVPARWGNLQERGVGMGKRTAHGACPTPLSAPQITAHRALRPAPANRQDSQHAEARTLGRRAVSNWALC